LRHKGQHFTVRGPLNVARSPQGRPVVAQAGSSDIGMELAARTADMVFTAQTTIKEGQDFCNEMRSRVTNYGRGPEDIRIFPGIMPIVGRTETEAHEKYLELRSLVDDGVGIAGVARLAGGVDIHALDPDGPLPPLKPSNAARARQEMIIAMGKRGMTIREIGRVLAMSQAHRVVYGTPKQLADDMQAWLEQGACDGFNLLFPHYPKPLEEWVTMVVPELQRRGLFREEYEGKTFRENLGVPIPQNVHLKNRTSVQVPAAAASND
jgi:FMN-dependent oxidoreductase (nitrilotriacetate monooxygenase family)